VQDIVLTAVAAAAPAAAALAAVGVVLPPRIEDTDTSRSTRASEDAMKEDLKWLGSTGMRV
jgi:glutamyl/glutaminyl-tRNA synthetase